MSKPSLLIASPAYGGLVTTQYLNSMLDTMEWLSSEDIPFYIYNMSNESHIDRARNTCATLALEKKFDKLLFIDADLTWKPEYVGHLYYSDKKIIGGLYPHKCYPITLNGVTLPGEKPNEHNELRVTDIATGFLMIDREVLLKLAESAPTYVSAHMNQKPQKYWHIFRSGVYDGMFLSEDFAFCRLSREAGFEVWASQEAICDHTGSHTFKYDKRSAATFAETI